MADLRCCGFTFAARSRFTTKSVFLEYFESAIGSQVSYDDCAVRPHSVAIQIILLPHKLAALSASPRASVVDYRTLPSCLPIYLSWCWVQGLADKNTNRHQHHRLRRPHLAPNTPIHVSAVL